MYTDYRTMLRLTQLPLLLLFLLGLNTTQLVACESAFTFEATFTTSYFNGVYTLEEGEQIISTTWDFGDGGTGTLENPIHTYPFYGTFHCCLTLVTQKADGTQCIAEFCQSVVLEQGQPCSVQVDFLSDDLGDGLVALSPEISLGGDAQITSFAWSIDSPSEELTAFDHQFSETGIYPVCLEIEAQNGLGTCTDVVCKDIEVLPFSCLIKADFEVSVVGCGIEAQWNGLLSETTEVGAWNWSVDGEFVDAEDLLALDLVHDQNVTVCLETEGISSGASCTAQHCVDIVGNCPDTTTDLEELATQALRVFPNPARGTVNIQGDNIQNVNILNMGGAVVLSSQDLSIDISHLAPGLYIVESSGQAGIQKSQLIIQ